jgi:hypothetical protein
MGKRISSILLGSVLALGAVGVSSVNAVTPVQNGAAEAKAKADAATRLKTLKDTRKKTDSLAKSQTDVTAKAKALNIGRLAVHNETKRRLEATRKAAEAHARIQAAQGTMSRAVSPRSGLGMVKRVVRPRGPADAHVEAVKPAGSPASGK